MSTTPQERLALGVVALLLAAGGGYRALRSDPPPAGLSGPPAAEQPADLSRLVGEAKEASSAAERAAAPLPAGHRLDPNTASAAELERLPKVGPAVAAAIVERRKTRPFRTLADLDSVSGVGPAVLAAVAPHVTLAPAPPSTPPPARSTERPGGAAERRAASSAAAPSAPPRTGLVDVNRAGAEELVALPGIGPALAARIVEFRERHGPFRSARDLEKVPGIGPKTAERLAPLVSATP